MNEITYHTPGFARDEDYTPETAEFETAEELLNLEKIRQWSDDPNFCHFAMTGNSLMCIENHGFGWWVIGFIKYPQLIPFNRWAGGKHLIELEGELFILSKEVISVCGEKVTLKDGRVGRKLKPNFMLDKPVSEWKPLFPNGIEVIR